MLSPAILRKNEIFTVCEHSGDIPTGAEFRALRVADEDDRCLLPPHSSIVCVGRTDDREPLFSAADGRYWFTLADGWGAKGDVLYGISVGVFFDLKRPATAGDAAAEFERLAKPVYSTWGGAMKYAAEVGSVKKILSVLKRKP